MSDIHVGMDGQSRVWPRASAVLLDDLETAHRKAGGFDCLIFSGDLVQKGSEAEYERFDKILAAILGRLADLGDRPSVVTVPGNHDLARPAATNPASMALSRFWHEPALREAIWDEGSEYRGFLEGVFESYASWRRGAIQSGVHLAPLAEGILPGDATYAIASALGQVGIVALNSTWLQLGAGDYDGQLHVDAKQLLAVTGNAPDEWARANAVNLLVTHQPASWLHPDSPASWDADINPAGRFDLHLFGHMHEPDVTSVAHGGGPARRNVQAASLFGLETYGDGHTRIQGYSANRVAVEGATRLFTSWPRRLLKVVGGHMKMVPDSTQAIDEETGALDVTYAVDPRSRISGGGEPVGSTREDGSDRRLVRTAFNIQAIHHPVPESRGHLKVRRIEQDACVAALEGDRLAWVASDWGLGKDGFIASICARLQLSRDAVYSIDFGEFDGSASFFDNLRTRLGGTFQEVCDAVADAGPCVLVLDDVEIDTGGVVEAAIRELALPLRDFASDARVVVRSRRRPSGRIVPMIELRPLDEADVAIYARESELGGDRFAKPDAVSKLFRHTDGVPARLDDALRDLEIVSLSDLMAANPDFGDATSIPSTAPAPLIATVRELARSDDRAEVRAYNLLLALSGLPQGEQLGRLTRFLGPHPFYPSHARALLERSLVDTVTITALDGMPGDDAQKALVVPRPVREHVRGVMDEDTAKSFDRKALDLYFGDAWASGSIASSPTARRVGKALCDGYEIQNAGALILRTARRSLVDENVVGIGAVIRLASAFVEVLMDGDHFRAAASLADDVIHLLDEFGGYEREVNVLRYELARNLRMVGRVNEAKAEFEALDLPALSKSQRQSAELGLALVLKRLGDDDAAADAARRAISIDRKSGVALHAKLIIAEQLDDAVERAGEMERLLAAAHKGKDTVLENNIRLTLAREREDDEGAIALLTDVIKTPITEKDFYNSVRAVIELAERRSRTTGLGDEDRARLMGAYHFLYNERLSSLFDRCHEALWNEFERVGEIGNLLNLFRHSSFIWRLGGREGTEARYLAKLVRMVRSLIASGELRSSRDGAYFVVRVSVVMTDLGDAITETELQALY